MTVKPIAYRVVKRKLNAAGFVEVAQKGSHVKFARTTREGTRIVIVPKHKEIAMGTLHSILKQAGLTQSQFDKL